MGYATGQTGKIFQGKTGDKRIIRTEVVLGSLINIIQTTITETTIYRGLRESTARSLVSTDTTSGGLVTSSLGGIKVTVTDGISTAYFSVFSCRGTISTAQMQRVGDSSLFDVTYTVQTLTCTADGGTVTDI